MSTHNYSQIVLSEIIAKLEHNPEELYARLLLGSELYEKAKLAIEHDQSLDKGLTEESRTSGHPILNDARTYREEILMRTAYRSGFGAALEKMKARDS